MGLTALLAVIVGGLFAAPWATALSSGDALTMYNAYNNAFQINNGNLTYYKRFLNNSQEDGSWTLSQDIFLPEDVYELNGDAATLEFVTQLLNTWIYYNPAPWDGDGWNDDIGWYTLALMRGYLFTGNEDWYNLAKSGYDMAFARGWNTTYNNGGIWETQPEPGDPPSTKCILSNFSLSRVACYIYQATMDADYLNQCEEIYNWVWDTLFDASTGDVIGCVIQTGVLQYGDNAYQQGLMADMANLLWLITYNEDYLRDAEIAITYAFNNVTTNGIFTHWDPNGTGYVDDLSRAVGRTVQNNRLWNTYYTQMVNNANSILENRRADLGITWNAWDQATPEDVNLWATQAVDASTWLQWVPAEIPNDIGGIHTITNAQTGLAIDSTGTFGNGVDVVQWALSGGQNQRWLLTPNSDNSWNIVNLATWKTLDCPEGADTSNLTMVLWQPLRYSNQRWNITQQSDGSYQILNQESQLALDGSSSTVDGYPLTQWPWNGGSQQLWNLG